MDPFPLSYILRGAPYGEPVFHDGLTFSNTAQGNFMSAGSYRVIIREDYGHIVDRMYLKCLFHKSFCNAFSIPSSRMSRRRAATFAAKPGADASKSSLKIPALKISHTVIS